MVNALHPCLLALLPVLHPLPKTGPAKVVEITCLLLCALIFVIQPNRTTEVFDALLSSIQLESKVISRKVVHLVSTMS